ncbi:MAG: hypothetical protein IJS76_07220 [Pseudobutyrivibrio sp.]|nr:hypothetical protein [Pseudobutyrivibrio sp.]
MADDKLRQELYYIAKLATKYDFKDMAIVEEILRQENERKLLTSVFGTRFKSRIFDIASDAKHDTNCVICGKPADNGVVCAECLKSILESKYAKSKNEIKENKRFHFKKLFDNKIFRGIKNFFSSLISKSKNADETTESKDISGQHKDSKAKRVFQYSCIVCLTLILFIQIYVLGVWLSLPTYNKKESVRESQYEATAVADENEALRALQKEFPETDGYTVTYSRQDREYVGRFLVDIGACCEEVEEGLSPEERYEYFFQEDVYVFYITKISDYSAVIGKAEVNADGAIVLTGSFNDGRATDRLYRFR